MHMNISFKVANEADTGGMMVSIAAFQSCELKI